MEMKVTAVQFLLVNRGMVKSNSAEHRKQLGGSWNWHLSGSFGWRGCEAAAIERDSSVRATGRRRCLLETFIRQRSQTRRPGEQRLCLRHRSISIHVYIVSASENHHGDHLLGLQHLHFKNHFLPSYLLEFILMSSKVHSQLGISLFCISAKKEKAFIQLHNCRKTW